MESTTILGGNGQGWDDNQLNSEGGRSVPSDEIGEIIADYLTWLRAQGKGSPSTCKQRGQFIGARLREWGVDGFNRVNIEALLGRSDKPLSAWSKSTYYSHLKSFATWALDVELITEDPFGRMPRPKSGSNRPHPISEDEYARLYAAASGRMRAWLILAAYAGLRAHEIAKIKGQDIQRDYIYVHGKGGKRELIPTAADIWELAQTHPRVGYWFTDLAGGPIAPEVVSGAVGRFFRSHGLDGSIHRVRHYYATRLLRSGANIRVVQRLMRHASLETTQGYTAVDDEELRAGIDRLSA